jgi:hypothetical protein
MDLAKTRHVSLSPTTVLYKFKIQVPRRIKNAINLDRKNKNNLWQEAMETELKQLTDYETFRDSMYLIQGRIFPKDTRKLFII